MQIRRLRWIIPVTLSSGEKFRLKPIHFEPSIGMTESHALLQGSYRKCSGEIFGLVICCRCAQEDCKGCVQLTQGKFLGNLVGLGMDDEHDGGPVQGG